VGVDMARAFGGAQVAHDCRDVGLPTRWQSCSVCVCLSPGRIINL